MSKVLNLFRRVGRQAPVPLRNAAWRLYLNMQKATLGFRYPHPRPYRLADGLQFMIDPRHRWIDWNLAVHGHYEAGTLSLMRKFLSPGTTFIDVGANIGIMSMFGARCVGSAGRVYSFEPDSVNFGRLVWARDANHLPNVIPLPLALGSSVGTAPLHRSPDADGGLTSLKELQGFKEGERVPIATLDDLFAAVPLERLSLIKIDVEGFEFDVVKGGLRLIERERPALIIEMVNESAVQAGQLLVEIGYVGFETDGKGLEKLDTLRRVTPHPLEHDNMLFVHADNCSKLRELGFDVEEG